MEDLEIDTKNIKRVTAYLRVVIRNRLRFLLNVPVGQRSGMTTDTIQDVFCDLANSDSIDLKSLESWESEHRSFLAHVGVMKARLVLRKIQRSNKKLSAFKRNLQDKEKSLDPRLDEVLSQFAEIASDKEHDIFCAHASGYTIHEITEMTRTSEYHVRRIIALSIERLRELYNG